MTRQELETRIQNLRDQIAKEHALAEAFDGTPLAGVHDNRAIRLSRELFAAEDELKKLA